MRSPQKIDPKLWLGFLIATACVIYTIESFVMRLLPLPFLRLGLSNVVVLYLVMENKFWTALAVNLAKSLIGGFFTFTLLSPSTLLSLVGGLSAILVMYLAQRLPLGFSIFGVSILGATAHNLAQLLLVKHLIIPGISVFVLTPILVFLGMFSGMIIAYLAVIFIDKITELRLIEHE